MDVAMKTLKGMYLLMLFANYVLKYYWLRINDCDYVAAGVPQTWVQLEIGSSRGYTPQYCFCCTEFNEICNEDYGEYV